MNDPVASRTQKTREYMQECDVVFFLSRASQFLDQSDMDLLTQQLPFSGVRRMVLVGGQLDGAVLDDGYDQPSLAATLDNLRRRFGARARAAMLRKLAAPILASTFAHGFAAWPPERWSEAMRHTHGRITEMAASEWGQPQGLTKEQWLEIANFAPLRQAYDEERALKAETLQRQKDGSARDASRDLAALLGQWRDEAAERLKRLQTQDLATLQAQQAALEKNLKDIARPLQKLMGDAIGKAREAGEDLKQSLEEDIRRFKQVKRAPGQQNLYEVARSQHFQVVQALDLGENQNRVSHLYGKLQLSLARRRR